MPVTDAKTIKPFAPRPHNRCGGQLRRQLGHARRSATASGDVELTAAVISVAVVACLPYVDLADHIDASSPVVSAERSVPVQSVRVRPTSPAG
jgi:hypothetical protein